MKERSDKDLLRAYAKEGSDSAFAEIVGRYTDLVYSAAWRQVGSSDLARDVAQTVFTDLARKANSLKLAENGSLVGWLYRATRYAALNAVRTERRRQVRERLAMEYFSPSETSPDWDAIAPVLDEAMAALSESDRDALLLRFFKNQDFRAVGAALGVSDDAAQKRVTRGMEKLRAALAGRGIRITCAALSTTIALKAVEAAPAGLTATLASVSLASAAAKAGTALTLLEFMAMSKTQIGIIGAVVMASVAAPFVIQQQAQAKFHDKEAVWQQQNARVTELTAANQRLSSLIAGTNRSMARPNGELLRLRGKVARLRKDVQELAQAKAAPSPNRADKLTSLAERYSEQVSQLKNFLAINPSESIPELRFLTDQNWLWLAGENTPDTAEGYQLAASLARQMAQENFAHTYLQPALKQYAQENPGQFPTDIAQLKPYFKSPVEEATLDRWGVFAARRLTHLSVNLRDEDWVITQKNPVNAAIDQRLTISLKKFHSFANGAPAQWEVAP